MSATPTCNDRASTGKSSEALLKSLLELMRSNNLLFSRLAAQRPVRGAYLDASAEVLTPQQGEGIKVRLHGRMEAVLASLDEWIFLAGYREMLLAHVTQVNQTLDNVDLDLGMDSDML